MFWACNATVVRVVHQCRLANAGRTDNGDEPRWRLIWNSVNKRHMEALLLDLIWKVNRRGREFGCQALTSWDLAACLASFPGLEKAKAFGFFSGDGISDLRQT